MDKLNVEELARVLGNHNMPADVINMLKAQQITGQDFMGLTDQELITFQFPLGYIKTINRVKAALSEKPPTVDDLRTPESSDKYSVLMPPFTQEELDDYTDYEKDAFLKKLERHRAIFGDKGDPFKGIRRNTNDESPAKKQKSNTVDHSPKPVRKSGRQSLNPRSKNQASGSNKSFTNDDATSSESDKEVDKNYEKDETDESTDDSDKENEKENEGKSFLSAQLTTFHKDRDSLKELKPHLTILDVNEILEKDNKAKKFVPYLKDGWLLVEKSRKLVYRTLMNHLCWSYVKHPNDVTMATREMLAKSIVCTYPQYQRPFEIKDKDPWSSVLLNLNNIMKRIQNRLPKEQRPRKGQRKAHKTKKLPTAESTVNIQKLALMNPDRNNQASILDGMANTFALRCNMRREGESITAILEQFPQFQHYKGNVLSEEFSRIHPNAEDMCSQLLELCPKILEVCRDKILVLPPFEDDVLTACLALAYHLPHPVDPPEQGPRVTGKKRPQKRKQRRNAQQQASSSSSGIPRLEELIVIKPPSVNIPIYVQERRAEVNKPVQPYLIGIVSPLTKKLLKFFIVLDGKYVDLEAVPSVRALDLLFKSFFVFYVHYPPSWSLFFRFLQTCLYKVFENNDEAPSSCVDAYRLFTSK